MLSIENISKIMIAKVTNGNVIDLPIEACNLWKDKPAIIYVVRRPGWALCRYDAFELSSRFGNKISKDCVANLYAIIKNRSEKLDLEGLAAFQSRYFNDNAVYIDLNNEFYNAFGNKSLLSQSLRSWNPFVLFSDMKAVGARLTEKKIEGNYKGEGLIKGGLFIITPDNNIVYHHYEKTGFTIPYEEIENVLASLSK